MGDAVMPQNTTRLNSAQPIVEDDGTLSQVFRTWVLQVERSIPIVGTGTPEGALEAPQYSRYVDEAVPAVPVEYMKMLPDVAGDRTKGWSLL